MVSVRVLHIIKSLAPFTSEIAFGVNKLAQAVPAVGLISYYGVADFGPYFLGTSCGG